MPDNNNDDKSIDNMSIDEINELYKNIIELPEEVQIIGAIDKPPAGVGYAVGCK